MNVSPIWLVTVAMYAATGTLLFSDWTSQRQETTRPPIYHVPLWEWRTLQPLPPVKELQTSLGV
jgi:hypothetical protein